MERLHGLRISVTVEAFAPITKSLHMTPSTPDDWEIVQLHAGFLESEILRQVCTLEIKNEMIHHVITK